MSLLLLLCRVPEHLDGIPILVLESNPEFESDEARAKAMLKDVSILQFASTCMN